MFLERKAGAVRALSPCLCASRKRLVLKGGQDFPMVIVEPGHFVGREERNIDGSEVDRAERCDVEREEFAELRGRSPAGDDQVFDAHAPVAGTVEAGFIGDEDACLETELARLRCTRGDVEGTFVDVEAAPTPWPVPCPKSRPLAQRGARAMASSCEPETPAGTTARASAMWALSTSVTSRFMSSSMRPTAVMRVMSVVPASYCRPSR